MEFTSMKKKRFGVVPSGPMAMSAAKGKKRKTRQEKGETWILVGNSPKTSGSEAKYENEQPWQVKSATSCIELPEAIKPPTCEIDTFLYACIYINSWDTQWRMKMYIATNQLRKRGSEAALQGVLRWHAATHLHNNELSTCNWLRLQTNHNDLHPPSTGKSVPVMNDAAGWDSIDKQTAIGTRHQVQPCYTTVQLWIKREFLHRA